MDEAQDQEQLRDIFNRFAAKAVRDFPQLAQSFLIYSPLTESFHGIAPADDALAARLMERMQQQAAERQQDSPGLAGSLGHIGGEPFILILKADHHAFTPRGGTVEDEVQRLLLHELGHKVSPGGRDGKARGESIADTYAYLSDPNHASASGAQDWQDLVLWQRSAVFVFVDDRKYFTAPVLEAAMDLETRYDLSALPAEDKSRIAYRLALLAQKSDEDLQRLSVIFAPARDAMDRSAPAGFAKLAEIMFADHGDLSDDVFRIGRAALLPALEGKHAVLSTRFSDTEMETLHFQGREWDTLRAKIEARSLNMRGKSALTTEANDMFLLGHFDHPPGSRPEPSAYEGEANTEHLRRAYDAFAELRRFQQNGAPVSHAVAKFLPANIASLPLQQTAFLAGKIAAAIEEKPDVVPTYTTPLSSRTQ